MAGFRREEVSHFRYKSLRRRIRELELDISGK